MSSVNSSTVVPSFIQLSHNDSATPISVGHQTSTPQIAEDMYLPAAAASAPSQDARLESLRALVRAAQEKPRAKGGATYVGTGIGIGVATGAVIAGTVLSGGILGVATVVGICATAWVVGSSAVATTALRYVTYRGEMRPADLRQHLFSDVGIVHSRADSANLVHQLKTHGFVAAGRQRRVLQIPTAADVQKVAAAAKVPLDAWQTRQIITAVSTVKSLELEAQAAAVEAEKQAAA